MKSAIRLGGLTLFVFGLYTYFSWSQGVLVIPFTISMLAGMLLFVQSTWLPIRFVNFMCCISGFVLLHIGITYNQGTAFTIEKIKAYCLFVNAIFFSLLFLKELLLLSDERLVRFFLYATLLVITSSIIHILFPAFQTINELYLGHVHGLPINTATRALRDIQTHGGLLRPFPFTTEPSHVAKFVFVTWSAWLYLSEKKIYTLFFIIALLLFLVIRSPIVLPLFGVGLIAILSEGDKQYKFRNFLLVSVFLLPVVLGFGYQILEGRVLQMMQGNDLSTFYRIILPNYFFKAILLNNPFMGVGLGNVEHIIDLYNDLDSRLMFVEYTPNWYYFTSFIAPILYFGIVGTIIFCSIFYLFFSGISTGEPVKGMIFFYCVFILANSIGSFYNLLFWAYIAIVYRFSLEKKL